MKSKLTKKITKELDWNELKRYYPDDYDMWKSLKLEELGRSRFPISLEEVIDDPEYKNWSKVDKDTEDWYRGRI